MQAEAERLIERVGRDGKFDLEAVEFFVRSSVLALGARVLELLLAEVATGRTDEPPVCACGHPPQTMRSTGVRTKAVRTILGEVPFARSRFKCPECGAARYPGDEQLQVEHTGFSPGMRRLMTRMGSQESFAEAAATLDEVAGVKVGAKDVERVAEATGHLIDDWMRAESTAALAGVGGEQPDTDDIATLYVEFDGTAIPMRPNETEGRKGKGEDGRARTREVKLGCVFTQTTLDEKGRPIRDPDTTTYVGAIEPSVDFGHRIAGEAVRRGMRRAEQVVVLTDGAGYNASIVAEHFPDAIHIIDFYHATKHLRELIDECTDHKIKGPFHKRRLKQLKAGRIEAMIEDLRQALPSTGKRRAKGLKKIAYFERRIEQMRYGDYKRRGLFIGSGVIEAGCGSVIGQRLKNSGMHWSVAGANAIIAARCCRKSRRFESFWENAAA